MSEKLIALKSAFAKGHFLVSKYMLKQEENYFFSHPCYCHFIDFKQSDSLHCSERRDDPKIMVLLMPTVPTWDSLVSFLKIYSQLLKQPNSQKCFTSNILIYKQGFSLTI